VRICGMFMRLQSPPITAPKPFTAVDHSASWMFTTVNPWDVTLAVSFVAPHPPGEQSAAALAPSTGRLVA